MILPVPAPGPSRVAISRDRVAERHQDAGNIYAADQQHQCDGTPHQSMAENCEWRAAVHVFLPLKFPPDLRKHTQH
jgi:hypothetical protein